LRAELERTAVKWSVSPVDGARVTGQPIILVDPSETREVLAERLRMQGYAITVAVSAAEGAELALADPPAAVVADLWMPGISGVQLCRLLCAEPATERVPVILRGPEGDRHSRFWAARAGASAYVGFGRMGDLARALSSAIAASPATDSFMQLCGEGEHGIRDRIAAHLDAALFESVLASEVRALSVCGNFARLFDLLSQFVARVTSYRWLAVYTEHPEWLGLHAHPAARQRSEEEARRALAPMASMTPGAGGAGSASPLTVPVLAVEDEDAYADPVGAPPILCPIRLGLEVIGTVALAPRAEPHPKDVELVSIIARELAGPLRIAALVEESQRLATIDSLTGLMNRRAFTASTLREIARSQRHGNPFCLLLLDVDHFKTINDRRGHPSGDVVLTAIGRLLGQELRKADFSGRWGGEEFVVVLTETTGASGLGGAERIRAAIATMKVKDTTGEPIPVTVSIGLAAHRDGDNVDSLVRRADQAMYEAKSSGRNRVAAETGAPKPVPAGDHVKAA
jgi:two-component system, cell cycle response regulator